MELRNIRKRRSLTISATPSKLDRKMVSKDIIKFNRKKDADIDARALREAGWDVKVVPKGKKYNILIRGSRVRNIQEYGRSPYASHEPMRKPIETMQTFRQPNFTLQKYRWMH